MSERLLRAFLVIALLSALAAVVLVIAPPALRVTNYEISGAASLSRDEVLAAGLIRDGESFFSVDASRIASNLEAEPRIAKASVRRIFPNSLGISIEERKPVACVMIESEHAQRLAFIDAEGVAYAYVGAEDASVVGRLPLLSGLRFQSFRPGARLPVELRSSMAALGEIAANEPLLISAFSEIRLVKPNSGPAELVLYPLYHRVPVRAAAVLSAGDLRSIILVLDALGRGGLEHSVSEIDFRTGTIVYRNKEAQSG